MHDSIDKLQKVLLAAPSASLERLAKCLLGCLLGVPVRIARGGDQRGGDGGVSGAGGRHLIFEARRYRENSRLDERSIVGEIDQAVNRDPALEAWLLVTTQEVPEQIQQAMVQAGENKGIGTVIIDWLQQPLPKLAVLAARYPQCFEAEIGGGHGHLLPDIAAMEGYDSTLKTIESELNSWAIGYEAIRAASHDWVREIWESPQRASARFGQNIAGGAADAHYVRRSELIDHLNTWLESASEGRVGALVGLDGVGKTWAAIDWLRLTLDRLPIAVLAPSSALGNSITTRTDLIRFIAGYLYNILGVRSETFWEQRVRRLLKRPAGEGPAFLLFFDGLNQRASFDWLRLFQQLQDDLFYQRTLTLMSARTSFFNEDLERLNEPRALGTPPYRIDVAGYDLTPGGTFDQKLALASLSRADLPAQLIEYAAVPRLFDLVIRLKETLGAASEVTMHRLLWDYGASTIATSTEGAFNEKSWRQFILQLAGEYRGANQTFTPEHIANLIGDASSTPDRIYQRVSGVIDSIFVIISGDGGFIFTPEFVHHALGLALVKSLESSGSSEEAVSHLDKFLDPIRGYDERAEILRAAVAITLQRGSSQHPDWLGTLCTRWIHTQNLPDSHLDELKIIAPELVEPLLDVIEASDGHALSTPRYLAINALASVDKNDQLVARRIAERGTHWYGFVSLAMRGTEADRGKNSSYAQRRERLNERIGVAEAGEVSVAGHVFRIVDQRGEDLLIAAAQLLQGRPLKDAIEFFEVAAIHTAIVGSGMARESQSWLNILNTIDPEETAGGLRHAAEVIASRTPEPGLHRDLTKRIASLLLWQTGYADDAERAWRDDPKIDHWLRYETDYLSDPSRSFFRLERRHAAQVLSDTRHPLIYRIERATEALLDPSFTVPPAFVVELTARGEAFDLTQTNIGRSRTSQDLEWKPLSLALARCAPHKLADLERRRLLGYAARPVEQRFSASLAAPDAMLLAGREESASLRTLRERGKGESEDDKYTTLTNLLITEIQCEPPATQVRTILEAGLDDIGSSLARACDSPSEEELDGLLDKYEGDKERLSQLASLLCEHDLTLSERAFEAFSNLLKPRDTNGASEAVWLLLASNDPPCFGAVLDEAGWNWSADRSFAENIWGSAAIAASNKDTTFAELVPRIAPAKLLEILPQRAYTREDVELVAKLLTGVLFENLIDPPDPGVVISHEQDKVQSGDYNFTAGDLVADGDDQDALTRSLERISSHEQYAEKRHKLIQSYIDQVKEARRAGARLYLAPFESEDFDPVLQHCPKMVDLWLEGLESSSADFIKRVRLAEGFFVGLCEVLLKEDPPRGISLWRVLRICLVTRFIGRGGIDRLVYALFAAPPGVQVEAVLEEIYSVDTTRTDEDLMGLIIAARCSGRTDWLRRMISRDVTSSCPAHRRRATFLEPLLSRPDIAGDGEWPSGEATGVYNHIHETAWILGQREAFAHYWLRTFAEATTPESAHAYWHLFKACADRRAVIWMQTLYQSHAAKDGRLEAAKRRFIDQEAYNLKHAMAENGKSWPNNFATHRYPKTLLPWNSKH